MFAEQRGVCAICREGPAVHVDHDHVTGAVRGLLCFTCNVGLGNFKDDLNRLFGAVEYLEGYMFFGGIGSDGTGRSVSGPTGRSTSGLPAAYLAAGSSSFTEFLTAYDPSLLPGARLAGAAGTTALAAPHGTTVVALTYPGGVVMAGDRRATMGNIIAQRDIEKVFQADEWSCVGIAGTAGIAVEMVRLFQVELEHYEKIEGVTLSMEGKANRLALMLRGNLGLAMQGLAVVPLFAGYDPESDGGRIFSYDVTGGRYEEHRHHGVGSGSMFARGSLKKLWREDLSAQEAVSVALEALYDAADDDSATGGPDLARRIFPIVAQVDALGFRRLPDGDLGELVRAIVARRADAPDGPVAPLTEV